MVAARVAFMPTYPVGLRARLGRVAQGAEVGLVAQLAEGLAHRLVGHRVQPQALGRAFSAFTYS